MEVLKSEQHLRGVELGLSKRELLPLDMQHEITTADVFHDKVHPSLSLKTRVQTKEEWVSFLGRREKYALLGAGTENQGTSDLSHKNSK